MLRTAVIAVGALLILPLLLAGQGLADRAKAPDDARAYILWPPNGAVINGGKFWVR